MKMNLDFELEAARYADTRSKFNELLIEILSDAHQGMTIDDLVCTPVQSKLFCDQVRKEAQTPDLKCKVILKALINRRKQNKAPTGSKTQNGKQSTAKRLQEAGSDLSAIEFKTIANDLFASMYKSRTFDEILCHPNEASDLAAVVRRRVGMPDLDDHFILKTIMNVRKAGA